MRKIQGIKRLSPGKYLVTVVRAHPTECDASGRPRKVKRKRTIEGSRQDAEKAHAELADALENELGLRHAPVRLTLADYARQWLALRAKRLKPSTFRKYMNDLENHILPALGNRILDDLRPRDIRAMLAKDKGAPNSRRSRLRLLSVMAKDAVADEIIDRDFCLRVTVKVPPVYTHEEPNLLAPAELSALLEQFDDEWLDALYVLAFTGMRWCEVAGLKWNDIDLDAATLHIRRANVKGILGPPKTESPRRIVGLPGEVVDRLRARHERMQARPSRLRRKGWLFPRPDGQHYVGYPLINRLKRACERAGIAIRFTIHGLRRTYNNLARRHVETLVVRSIVGHTSERMTEHYSQVDVREKIAASEAVLRTVRQSASDETDGKVVGKPDSPSSRDESETQVTFEVTHDPSEEGPENGET